jgi:pimeloyl-ACP methyl ester carboxylesterase
MFELVMMELNQLQTLGENFLDGKCMQSNRPVYNNILEIPERMRNLHLCLGNITMILALFLIGFSTMNVNRGIAQDTQNQNFPYQTPLFSSLDDREVGEANPQSDSMSTILQNATISQVSSASNAEMLLDELAANTSNFARDVDDTQEAKPIGRNISTGSFMLDKIQFKHYRDDVNGITMHYVMGGEGDAIVLLHSWPQTWFEWREVMPILAKNNFTVIVPDLRGLGDTSKPSSGYDGNTTASDIYELVSGIGFNTTYVIGHDIGAQTAYSYASTYPNNVSKLVVIDYVFPGLYSNKSFAEPWWFLFHRALDLPEALVAGNEREYLSWFYRQLAYNPYSVDEAAIDEYVRQYSAPGGMRSGFEYFRASQIDAILNNQTSRSNLTIPILALSGEFSPFGDGDSKPNHSLESAKRLAKNVSTVLLPSSGHWIPEEQPGPLAGLIINFFNEEYDSPLSKETGSRTATAIEDLIKTIDNESLIEANTSQPDYLSTSSPNQTTSVSSTNLSAGPVQGPGSGGSLLSDEKSASQANVSRNGTVDQGRNLETQIHPGQSEGNMGDELIVNQGTPLSEAIEAISKLFGRNNGG